MSDAGESWRSFEVLRSRLEVFGNESASIGQTDLRQVQDRAAPGRRPGDLPESKAQAAAGLKSKDLRILGILGI
jgi:hypothetical protein